LILINAVSVYFTDSKASPLLTKHSKILNSCKTSRFIITAVSELLSENESYTREGVPPEEIKAKLFVYEPSRFTPETTQIFLDREINVGTLVEGPGKRLFPKDIAIPESKSAPEKKMRGRKSNATKEKEAAAQATPSTSDPNAKVKEEVLAIKSAPNSKTPESGKAVRAYGRKPAEKKLLVLVNHDNDEETEESTPASTETEEKPVPKPEETTTGRSVRNKRKKEVFDPSDIVPKKRQSLTTPVKEKPSPQTSKAKSPAAPTPPAPAKKSNAGRKKKVVEPEPVLGNLNLTSYLFRIVCGIAQLESSFTED